jgi:hypothetical protein
VAREYHAAGATFPYWVVGTFNYPEAAARIRSREVSVTEAVRMACDLDLTYKEIFKPGLAQRFNKVCFSRLGKQRRQNDGGYLAAAKTSANENSDDAKRRLDRSDPSDRINGRGVRFHT